MLPQEKIHKAFAQAQEKVHKARVNLILDYSFFGTLALRLKSVEDNTQDTFYTDGKVIGYNSEFVDSLSLPEVTTILCHEILHCACMHMFRRGNRDDEKWNRACDYVVNDLLVRNNFKLPDNALLDSQYSGKCAEDVYNLLPQDDSDNDTGKGKTNPFGEVRDFPGDNESEKNEAEGNFQIAIKMADKIAKSRGVNVGISEDVAQVTSTKVDWQNMLRKFVSESSKNDYTMSRPNKRYVWQGLYLPSLYSQEIGEIVIAVDTSASVSKDELDGFLTEISSILAEVQPKKTIILHCDSKIHDIEEYEQGEEIKSNFFKGRGGTRFEPVFEYIENEGIQPNCLIYLTDLESTFDKIENPCYPVLWVSTRKDLEAPIGETIYL